MDVYHTSTYGVVLVRIWNAGLHAACWNDAKKSPKIGHLGTIAQFCRGISLQLRHVSTIGKKLVKQQYLLQMSPQAAEIGPVVWGTPANFNGFRI